MAVLNWPRFRIRIRGNIKVAMENIANLKFGVKKNSEYVQGQINSNKRFLARLVDGGFWLS